MGGLEDGIGQAGLDQCFLNVALAVVVQEFAQGGVQDGGVDEVLDVIGQSRFDHVVTVIEPGQRERLHVWIEDALTRSLSLADGKAVRHDTLL